VTCAPVRAACADRRASNSPAARAILCPRAAHAATVSASRIRMTARAARRFGVERDRRVDGAVRFGALTSCAPVARDVPLPTSATGGARSRGSITSRDRKDTKMKKKLFLNRETVRKLTTSDLHEVIGGKKTDSSECTIIPHIPATTFPDQPALPAQPVRP
jgi:hypothetical protein